jgi:hypothetical protein
MEGNLILTPPCVQNDSLAVPLAQAYWPYHRADCHRNEFADATEGSEPNFARWMRSHRSWRLPVPMQRLSTATLEPARR